MSGGTHASALVVEELDEARNQTRAIEQFAGRVELTLDSAYETLLAGIALRHSRGERVVGLKLGFTSKEKAEQMGVSDVILGVLTDRMRVWDGGLLDCDCLIDPRVEPEIAFLLSEDIPAAVLAAPGEGLLAYVTHVASALEVIDSRYQDFTFSLEDVVADNASASHFAVGAWHELTDDARARGLSGLGVELRIDSTVEVTGSTSAIMGDPLQSLMAAHRLALRHGHPLEPGCVVLAGSATAAVALPAGALVEAAVEGLGPASLRTFGQAEPGARRGRILSPQSRGVEDPGANR